MMSFLDAVGGVLINNVMSLYGVDVDVSVPNSVVGDFGSVVGGDVSVGLVRVVPYHNHYSNLFRSSSMGHEEKMGDFCITLDELAEGSSFIVNGVSFRVVASIPDVYGYWINELVRV